MQCEMSANGLMPKRSSDPPAHESTKSGMMNELLSVALQQSTERGDASPVDRSDMVESQLQKAAVFIS
jgi:hypothetical protein